MLRFAAAVAILCATAAAARAEPTYDVSVRVDAEGRHLEGHARIVVPNDTGAPVDELMLWRFPERFATRSPALNDYNFYWVYPYRFNPGRMRTGAVIVDGRAASVEVRDHPRAGKGTLLHVALDPPLAPGASATVDVDFTVEIPTRYGPFGCIHGVCTLTGFYPMVAPLGYGLDAMPGRGRYRMNIAVADVSDVVVNGELRALERGRRLDFDVGEARGLSLIVGKPRLLEFEREVRGIRIVYLSPTGRHMRSPPEHVLPYQPANHIDQVLDTAAEAVELLGEIGAPLPKGEEVRIVAGPLRIQLAQTLPGVVLVSDQLFDIFPLQRFLKFHEFELARAIYEAWVTRRTLAVERADDIGWAPGAAASYLVDLYTLRSYRKAEFAREILAWASFIPAIDRVMYAPQVPFASSYFYTLEDPDPLRDNLQQFDNTRPTGKTIYTKLRDLLGTRAVDLITRAQLGGAALRPEAEKIRGQSLEWFWTQWLGPYPPVDYRFADVHTERLDKHGYRTVARVVKVGEHAPVEPVEVRATDHHGNVQNQTWDGQGREHSYVFDMPADLSVIEIDPRGRLVENLPGDNNDLKFDDRQPPRWKFIYNNFGGLLRFFPTLGLDLSLDFSLSRILDLKHGLRFVIYRSEATQVGITSSYSYGFGRKITAARLSSAFGVSLGVARIDPSFAQAVGAGTNPGTLLTASASWGYDDRLFVWEPMKALSLGAGLAADETILDNGQVLSQGVASLGWESIVPLADGHGLAMSVGGALTFGDLKIARQMLSAGGDGGLRGYDVASLLGRWRAIGRVEWRHIFTHELDINFLHSLYVRGIGGALFAEAGVVSPCESYSLDSKSFNADVGYSVRIFGDWFGVSQTTINIDFAVPLVQHDRACFGTLESEANKVPFGFYFSFGPPW
ncbi:MAG TPA: hypothetical protein VN947_22715 [Polyangia bacterium]|nr:hypothetical protein [Polyangia bacterium]